MRIDIKDSDVCQKCRIHNCSFLNMAKTKTDFYNLPSETVICPTQAISEEGPSERDLRDGKITESTCVKCGLCIKFCEHQNLAVSDFDFNTDDFQNMTEPQINAATSVYLSTLFKFSANTNRNRSLLFDGYISDIYDEAFVEVDWADDSLESLRRILGDILTYSKSHNIKQGLIVLSHLPREGSRDVFTLIKKMKSFPTTSDIEIYITTFSLLRAMCLYLKNDTYTMKQLFFDSTTETIKDYVTRIRPLFEEIEIPDNI